MVLNTFAPPFRLVGGYFIVGVVFLFLSIFAFLKADLGYLMAFNTAGFAHVFFVGFVMSIIIGALYQLTSVILESPFYSIKFAFANLFVFCFGTLFMSFGMMYENMVLLNVGGVMLFISLMFFALSYFLSFLVAKKRSFAKAALFVSSIFLMFGITLGICMVMFFAGIIEFDFEILLKFHIYFILGFVFFVIVGVASVLLPMFSLSHGVSFLPSKISLLLFMLSGFLLQFNMKAAFFIATISVFMFVFQAFLIIKKRVRRAYDYWNLNVVLSLISLVLAFILGGEFALWLGLYGFLYPFIVAHIYKIVPFLIWYHYVSPFVGKIKVPMLDDMINKKFAYVALVSNILSLIFYKISLNMAVFCLIVSVVLVILNMFNFFKYVKFGVKNER